MAGHAFHEIYLHINWHIDHDCPMTPDVEGEVHAAILGKCRMTKGVYVHGIGGTETHVHLAMSIEPTVMISDLVGQLKGESAHEVNKRHDSHPINWKRGYGVVSFSKRDLPWVLDYVANQKEHHRQGTVSPKLEQVDAPPPEGGGEQRHSRCDTLCRSRGLATMGV